MGIDILRWVDLHKSSNPFTVALLPILVPGLYGKFPTILHIILEERLVIDTPTAVLFNILFHDLGQLIPQAAPATANEPA